MIPNGVAVLWFLRLNMCILGAGSAVSNDAFACGGRLDADTTIRLDCPVVEMLCVVRMLTVDRGLGLLV